MKRDYPDGVQEMQLTKKGTLNVASAGADFCEEYVDKRDFFDTQYSQNEWIL